MFEKFTDKARRVVVLAQEEAKLLKHNYIGTEHILLGLIHEGEGVAAKALESLNISLDAVREQVQDIIGQGQQQPTGHIPFTPRAKKVLELSLREALQLGHNYIGTEHILLGLIREGEGVAAQVLVKLGADLAINYRSQDFVAEVKAFTKGKGAGVILDMVGGDYVQRNYEAAAVEGRIVQIAFMNGYKIQSLDMRAISAKRLTHTGSTLRPRSAAYKAQVAAALRERVWPLVALGRVRPVIHQTFPAAQAAEAHALLEASQHVGKIVLTW